MGEPQVADDNDTSGDFAQTPHKSKAKPAEGVPDPNALVAVFGSVAAVFQRSPLSALLAALVMGASVAGYVAYSDRDVRSALLSLVPASSSTVLEQQARKARKEIRREDEVCNLVEAVGKRISAHRLIYFRYSGESQPTASNPLPWRYTSAVCVYPKPGVDYDIAGAQNVPASLSSQLQIDMFPLGNREGACGRWHIEDINSSYLRSRFEKNGTDLKIACGQVSPQGLPTGSLSADWLDRSAIKESEEQMLSDLRDTLGTITELQSKPVQ